LTDTSSILPPSPTFNSAVEVGLRALCVLTAGHPERHSLQRLTIYDYLLVHSDDIDGGPAGLHPRTPHRSGELLARRGILQDALLLYASRGLIDRRYDADGVHFAASDLASGFLDTLTVDYVHDLRDRADWIAQTYGAVDDAGLVSIVDEGLGRWGAEFTMQSVLSSEGWA
jgi:hypothetical protein